MKIQPNRNIQVLRGLSVIGVILFHAFPNIFKNGYFGVDVFFLISGFVIAPALEKINEGHLELRDFFRRRFWRLAPALVFTLLVSLPLLTLLGNIGSLKNIYTQAISALFLTSSLTSYLYLGDYFNPAQNPLIHTWSLSVEQQIYLTTPITILLIKKVNKKFKLLHFFILCGIISLLISFQIDSFNAVMNFYSPFYRYSQFCLGALIYFLSRKSSKGKLTDPTIIPIVLISVIFIFFVLEINNFIWITLILLAFYRQLFITQFPNNKF